jgi:hypothetical protein
MDYHIARNNQKLGVFAEEAVRARLQSGEFLPSDLVWCEGMPAWKPASEVFHDAVAASPVAPPVVAPSPTPFAGGPPVPSVAPAAQVQPPPPKPDNRLVWAILATLFCCMPFGIAAIVFAAQVDSKYAGGDYAGAQKSADNAKLWLWISFGIGCFKLLGVLAYLAMIFFFGIAAGLPH